MMFVMHLAFFVGMIALMSGLSMFIWGLRSEGSGKELAKFVGLIIVILVFIDFACVGYYALNYWREGYFASPVSSMMQDKSIGASMINKQIN